MSTPPANDLHHRLRMLTMQRGLPDAIACVFDEISKRGKDVVKADPGVYAWVMENQLALSRIANLGGLHQ